jgi:hypothetical protein
VAHQTRLTANVENTQAVKPVHKVSLQKTYRRPEITDLGKASELLQGGGCSGRDNSWATYC